MLLDFLFLLLSNHYIFFWYSEMRCGTIATEWPLYLLLNSWNWLKSGRWDLNYPSWRFGISFPGMYYQRPILTHFASSSVTRLDLGLGIVLGIHGKSLIYSGDGMIFDSDPIGETSFHGISVGHYQNHTLRKTGRTISNWAGR